MLTLRLLPALLCIKLYPWWRTCKFLWTMENAANVAFFAHFSEACGLPLSRPALATKATALASLYSTLIGGDLWYQLPNQNCHQI